MNEEKSNGWGGENIPVVTRLAKKKNHVIENWFLTWNPIKEIFLVSTMINFILLELCDALLLF